MTELSENFHFKLHPAQHKIFYDTHRFKVVDAGRQFGKSQLAGVFGITYALQHPYSEGWIISPSYRQSTFLWKKIKRICEELGIPIIAKSSNHDISITFKYNGSVIRALSSDDPDKLRGETLSLLIVDEAAMMANNIWTEHLRPMMMVHKAPAMFISTPKGKNWFYDIYQLGVSNDPKHKDWISFKYTSLDNPLIDKGEIDAIREQTPESLFLQEYMGEFLDAGGEVFNHYAVAPMSGKAEDGHVYIAGLDLARQTDFTVLTIADINTLEVVDILRMNTIDWYSQISRIKEYLKRYHWPTVYADSTGVGDAIVNRMIQEEGLDVRGLVFSARSKTQMIQNLAVMLQKEELVLPDLPMVKDEFDRYSYKQTQSGALQYSAPSGYHDDIVCSFALLAWGAKHCAQDIGGYYEDKKSKDNDRYSLDPFRWDYDYCADDFSWDYPELY